MDVTIHEEVEQESGMSAAIEHSEFTVKDLRDSDQLTISRKEAALALGVGYQTITRAIEDGDIPTVRIGRRLRIPREKFLEMFA